MTVRAAAAVLIAAIAVGSAVAQTTTFPVLDITKGSPLPTLQQLQPVNDWITLNMLPATIQVLHHVYSSSMRNSWQLQCLKLTRK